MNIPSLSMKIPMRQGESLTKSIAKKILSRKDLRKKLGLEAKSKGSSVTLYELLQHLEKVDSNLGLAIRLKVEDLGMEIWIREKELSPEVAQEVLQRRELRELFGLEIGQEETTVNLNGVLEKAETAEAPILQTLFSPGFDTDQEEFLFRVLGAPPDLAASLLACHLRSQPAFSAEALCEPLWRYSAGKTPLAAKLAAMTIKHLPPEMWESFVAELAKRIPPELSGPIFVTQTSQRLVTSSSMVSLGKFIGRVAINLYAGNALLLNSVEFLKNIINEPGLKLGTTKAGWLAMAASKQMFKGERLQARAMELLAEELYVGLGKKKKFLAAIKDLPHPITSKTRIAFRSRKGRKGNPISIGNANGLLHRAELRNRLGLRPLSLPDLWVKTRSRSWREQVPRREFAVWEILEAAGTEETRKIKGELSDETLEQEVWIREPYLTAKVAREVLRRNELEEMLGWESLPLLKHLAEKTSLKSVINKANALNQERQIVKALMAARVYRTPSNIMQVLDIEDPVSDINVAFMATYLRMLRFAQDEIGAQELPNLLKKFIPRKLVLQEKLSAKVMAAL